MDKKCFRLDRNVPWRLITLTAIHIVSFYVFWLRLKTGVYTWVHKVWSGSKSVVMFGLIKISTHPCNPRNFDWFSWECGKKNKKWPKQKKKNGRLKKKGDFQNRHFSNFFRDQRPNIMHPSVGINDKTKIWCLTLKCGRLVAVLLPYPKFKT